MLVQLRPAHGIDPAPQAMKASGDETVPDRVDAESERDQLTVRHDSVLAFGE
jgi:hypothetical protein